jgi:hypothetical protein
MVVKDELIQRLSGPTARAADLSFVRIPPPVYTPGRPFLGKPAGASSELRSALCLYGDWKTPSCCEEPEPSSCK